MLLLREEHLGLAQGAFWRQADGGDASTAPSPNLLWQWTQVQTGDILETRTRQVPGSADVGHQTDKKQ